MTTPKAPEVLQEEALNCLSHWRKVDKVATINKGDHEAKKIEYRARKNLRTAADNLPEVPHV